MDFLNVVTTSIRPASLPGSSKINFEMSVNSWKSKKTLSPQINSAFLSSIAATFSFIWQFRIFHGCTREQVFAPT